MTESQSALEPPVAEITCLTPGGEVVQAALHPGRPLVVGRAADCQLSLRSDPRASRHHCVLEWHDGRVHVTDLESRNGVYVNGERVQSTALESGDAVQVAGSTLALEVIAADAATAQAGFCGDCGRLVTAGPLLAGARPRCARCRAGGPSNPQIPGYQIIRPLGEGFMGRVYHARDTTRRGEVALKILAPRQSAVAAEVAVIRFLREAHALGAVDHPAAVRFFDSGEHEGYYYLVMEYVDGEDFQRVLDRDGPLPVGEVLAVGRSLCACIGYAHERGVLHRDLKPANIFRARPDGCVKVADFGLADLAGQTGLSLGSMSAVGGGSPAFASPEQLISLNRATTRSDVYGAGATLYALCTGRLPFEGRTVTHTVMQVFEEPPPDAHAVRPEVPEALAAHLIRAMAKAPEERFPDMAAFGDALEALAN